MSSIERSATFSADRNRRFTLVRAWREGSRVCFIGLNPSTADEKTDDPTVRRWAHFAQCWGFSGFVAVNLYPFRTASPVECRLLARSGWQANRENLEIVAREAKRAGLVVACWGAAGAWIEEVRDLAMGLIRGGPAPHPDIHIFGETADGSPIHPMARGYSRVGNHAQPRLWLPSPDANP